ncbi:MAG: hypothetical protein R3Y11_02745 [Pseudomonadota bacterium]
MEITWNITKKRGNFRPTLTYTVSLAEHERALALPFIRIQSTIPEPSDAWQEFCYPNQHERTHGHTNDKYYNLEIPSHKKHTWQNSLRLPWREDNHYPEIRESLEALRSKFEELLHAANASLPMDENDSLAISESTRDAIAPAVLGARFLQLARSARAV